MITLPYGCWKLTAELEFDDFVRFGTKFTAVHNNNSDLGFELASYKAATGLC